MLIHLEPWQWAILVVAAFLIGLSKTGIVGLGTFAVAMFAIALPPRESVGAVLPILISADIIAVLAYRRHAVWRHLVRIFPWAAVGIFLGYLSLNRISDQQIGKVIGGILLVLVVLQAWRQWRIRQLPEGESLEVPHSLWFIASAGILAGWTTMVANAAGPIMILYLLAMQLPKMEFLGTAAWYFMLLNLFKVPFSLELGLLNPSTLALDLRLAPVAMLGALSGRVLIRFVNQSLFEMLALIFTILAALRLLF